ncbi:MAG: hypothetical protein GY793_08415 [Proteobacteria bacterium]|nr:hypothetical protein [Pseudomonadota bacterium]
MQAKTLGAMIQAVRVAIRLNSSRITNESYDETIKQFIVEAERFIYHSFILKPFNIRIFKPLEKGQKYYDVPSEIGQDNLQSIILKNNGRWEPESLRFGILLEDYNHTTDSKVRKFDYYNKGKQIEVWPVPTENSIPDEHNILCFSGKQAFEPMLKETDIPTLDPIVIEKLAAANLLAYDGNKGAPIKEAEAMRYISGYVTNLNCKESKEVLRMGSSGIATQISKRNFKYPHE